MRLTGNDIVRMRDLGRLHIDPFDEAQVGPNSYDLRLGPKLKMYTGLYLDTRKKNDTVEIEIPPEGFVLWPGVGYLGSTVESCGSDEFVCDINGRSSIGRCFLLVHCTAGDGDLGFGPPPESEEWTLELVVVSRLPVVVYAGDRIAQAKFYSTSDDRGRQYKGRYAGQKGPTPTRAYEDFLSGE